MSTRIERGFDVQAASRQLRRLDPAMARWMRKIGPIDVDERWSQRFDLVDALARAILYQQLSGKAAATIIGRVEVACASRRLSAKALSAVEDEVLRGCGVSRNKLLALRDLGKRALDKSLPGTAMLDRLDNEAIIQSLIEVRGIGRWTVEMLLMFRLGRADVFPIDDLGIRKGVQRVLELDVMPTPKQAAEHSLRWTPVRTLASLYLWRIADTALM